MLREYLMKPSSYAHLTFALLQKRPFSKYSIVKLLELFNYINKVKNLATHYSLVLFLANHEALTQPLSV